MKNEIFGATIISKKEHNILKKNIDKRAIGIIHRLKKFGFDAYIVGGGVRDLLLRKKPKDFDIATNAHPHEIKKIFKNCRLIGKRFRLAHIFFGKYIIEVATFRSGNMDINDDQHKKSQHGIILRDNIYGTIVDDAIRRDFTINALYLDVDNFCLLDFLHGFQDFKNKTISIIGDAIIRYQEDPVRMLRAVRFVAKLNFELEENTKKEIFKLAPLLKHISPSRLYDELIKIIFSGALAHAFETLLEFKLACYLFSDIEKIISNPQLPTKEFIITAFAQTDKRIQQEQKIAPAFIFAIILWYPIFLEYNEEQKESKFTDRENFLHFENIIKKHLTKQKALTNMLRVVSLSTKEILILQFKFEERKYKSVNKILKHPRFRAAYDLFTLRAQFDKKLKSTLKWWQVHIENSQTSNTQG